MVKIQNIDIRQNQDYRVRITIKNPDETPKNLNGHTVESLIKRNLTDSNSDAVSFNAAVTNPELGLVELFLSNDDTNTFKLGEYSYDVVLRDDAEDINIVILTGCLNVQPTSTRGNS